ncbi:hypothetical protein C2845_PMPSC055421 [Panicum miliaceum]|uniref:Uncharacterized protein n=1 Tax=Panicum miliaceum TaxID=4540 RepID=A0A3L6P9Q2_PANMI|nr:hypothetical protein C2845_PMPSC055421 [Panicum miliaceum]
MQVNELLDLIRAQKETGVTGASVLASMYKRCIMPLQKRCRFGFEYLGSSDPSRLSSEILPPETAIDCVRRVLLDVNTVPYVPKLFSAGNPPNPGHTDLYQCPGQILTCLSRNISSQVRSRGPRSVALIMTV